MNIPIPCQIKLVMSDNAFNQFFVFCSVCHQRSSTGSPLLLSSCAHLLCSKHFPQDSTCPVCQTKDISTIKLLETKSLPGDVKIFFEPLPNILENIYNVSLFQMNGLNEQVLYYQQHCIKLREKVARQQQLLYQAKNELDNIPALKQKIQLLEETIQQYRVRSKNSSKGGIQGIQEQSPFFQKKAKSIFHSASREPPPTVDLTTDNDSNDYEEQQQRFVSKLKQNSSWNTKKNRNHATSQSNESFSQQKINGRSNTVSSMIPSPRGINHNHNKNPFSDSKFGNNSDSNNKTLSTSNDDMIMAESTQINKYNLRLNNKSNPNQILSPSHIPSLNGMSSPSTSNKKNQYYLSTQNKKLSVSNSFPDAVNRKENNNLLTPPSGGQTFDNKLVKNKNEGPQRRRLSTVGGGRIQFPTPLEKLKFGKRNVTTTGKGYGSQSHSSSSQYMKKRSTTSQMDSHRTLANNFNKFTTYK